MTRLLILSLLPSLCLSVASAQPGRGFQQGRRPGQGFQQRGGGRSSGGSRPGTAGSATLERAGVKVGQKLPDLTIFDEHGDKFRLADVKGKYTVIVFGCLT